MNTYLQDPLEHELGRPELFPSSCSIPVMEAPSDRGASKSQFYANSAWYGSSPCLTNVPAASLMSRSSSAVPSPLLYTSRSDSKLHKK